MATDKPSQTAKSVAESDLAPTNDGPKHAANPTPGLVSAGWQAGSLDCALSAEDDAICDAFEAAIQAGDVPRLEDFMARAGDQPPELLFRGLLLVECEYREKQGESPAAAEYIARFPDRERLVREIFAQRNPPARPVPNPVVLGDYEILEELGGGGMGVVYKARHRRLRRIVALKTILSAHTCRPEALQRFVREIEAVGRLNHPNLVQCTDAREESGVQFLVMEYIEGADLGAIVKRGGPLNVPDACEIVRQTAVGLEHVREQGLVHRDIKPSNLMLTPQGTVKILDLGLARLREESAPGEDFTQTGQTMGTPDYMAPEQATDAAHVDIRADLYSLGCTFYHLLVGRPPFAPPDYATPPAKILAHVQAEFPCLSDDRGGVPSEVTRIIARMVAKRPEDRFNLPAEVAEAIAPWCTEASLVKLLPADAVRRPEPSARGTGRRPMPKILPRFIQSVRNRLVVAAMGLLITAGVVGIVASRPGPATNNPEVRPDTQSPEVLVERALLVVRHNGDDERIRKLDLFDRADRDFLASSPLSPTDDFGFRASFNRPIYWYLAWLDTKGAVEIAARSEKAEEVVRFPAGNQLVKVDPRDPSGLHLLLLLVADRPSPNIESEILQRLSALGPPKQSTSKPLQIAVARTRGMGSSSPTTVDLDAEYIAQIEQKLPDSVLWVYQLYLPTQR